MFGRIHLKAEDMLRKLMEKCYRSSRRKCGNQMKKLWNWKISIIRKYPVWCAYVAWIEGLIIGILLCWFFS